MMYYLYDIRRRLILVSPVRENIKAYMEEQIGFEISNFNYGSLIHSYFIVEMEHKYKSKEYKEYLGNN